MAANRQWGKTLSGRLFIAAALSLALAFDLLAVPVSAQFPTCAFTVPSLARVSGRQLIVEKRRLDGSLAPPEAHRMKGVNWAPASRGSGVNDRQAQYGPWHTVDIPRMKELGVNTVRVFLDFGLDRTACDVLDELHRHEIMAIVTVDSMVNNTQNIDRVVRAYKNHPAVLMWALGNEWNQNLYFSTFTTIDGAVMATERAVSQIRSLDADHPITSSLGEDSRPGRSLADIVARLPGVDLWALNVYRGGISFGDLFTRWAEISPKPMFLAEFGTDAFNQTAMREDQALQADTVGRLWDEIATNLSVDNPQRVAIGGCVFEWNDEWWKFQAGSPSAHDTGGAAFGGHPDGFANEEWFGILDIDRLTRQAASVLQNRFFSPSLAPSVVVTVNGTTFRPGQTLEIGLVAQNPATGPRADVYVAVLMADGRTLVFFTDSATLNATAQIDQAERFARLRAAPPGFVLMDPRFLRFTFAEKQVPAGTYRIFAALIRESALSDNGIDPGDVVALDARTITVLR